MHGDTERYRHRQMHEHTDERGLIQRDDIECRHDWVSPSGGGCMDDLRHFSQAPRHSNERAFGRNTLSLGAS